MTTPGTQMDADSDQSVWGRLRSAVARQSLWWCGSPSPGWAAQCRACHGPARAGRIRCFQCDLHAQSAPGSLAAAVVPVAYAVKGGAHATDLWVYKSGGTDAQPAGRRLAVLLAVFLREHASCVWRAAGITGPTHVAVVPSGRGRQGPHPLRVLVQPYLCVPWTDLSPRAAGVSQQRDLDPDRFCAPRLPGARVLLLDDTWTSGASAQSAAMALRRAGAAAVAVIVLGRHLACRPGPGSAVVRAGPPVPPPAVACAAEAQPVCGRPDVRRST